MTVEKSHGSTGEEKNKEQGVSSESVLTAVIAR
jgi:hypothetical protein